MLAVQPGGGRVRVLSVAGGLLVRLAARVAAAIPAPGARRVVVAVRARAAVAACACVARAPSDKCTRLTVASQCSPRTWLSVHKLARLWLQLIGGLNLAAKLRNPLLHCWHYQPRRAQARWAGGIKVAFDA